LKRGAILLVLAALAGLLLLSLIGHPQGVLSVPDSELAVKLWVWEDFGPTHLFAKHTDRVGWPEPGILNNPDPVGTLTSAVLRPFVGRYWAFNLHVVLITFLNLLSAWSLARFLTRDDLAALLGAAAFALTPFVVLYCIDSAIIDVLNLWPWVAGIRYALDAGATGSRWKAGVSGLLFGAGLLACVYNTVVFAGALLPLAFLAPMLLGNLKKSRKLPTWTAALAEWGGLLLCVAAPFTILAVFMVGSLHSVTSSSTSQLPAEFIASTRHVAPYLSLHPSQFDRMFTNIQDFFAVGPSAVIERQAAARFLRAYAPGFVVWAFALIGALRFRGAWIWMLLGLWGLLASTGPYLPLNESHYLPHAWNPAWILPRYLIPGSTLLLEPFRYVIWAVLGLSMAAACGVAWIRQRTHAAVPVVALLLFLGELVALSPIPIPLPTTDFEIPEAYAQLDEVLPPGAIIELPYHVRGGKLFDRRHFLHLLAHERPIPDIVLGFVPPLFKENQFLADILHVERPYGALAVRVSVPGDIPAHRQELAGMGVAGIIVDPMGYRNFDTRERVLTRLDELGPRLDVGGRILYRVEPLPPGSGVPDRPPLPDGEDR
jgi:hypothetical protein